MKNNVTTDLASFAGYADRLCNMLRGFDWSPAYQIAEKLRKCKQNKSQVFLCGNGGSAANAMHFANDLIYGVGPELGEGIRVNALSDNNSILTCLGNDIGYEFIFSHQLATLANPGDMLVVFSGSGNSPNIVSALEQATAMGVDCCAILGFDGGKAKRIAETTVHFPIDDMQISEDLQLIAAHMITRWLCAANKVRNTDD